MAKPLLKKRAKNAPGSDSASGFSPSATSTASSSSSFSSSPSHSHGKNGGYSSLKMQTLVVFVTACFTTVLYKILTGDHTTIAFDSSYFQQSVIPGVPIKGQSTNNYKSMQQQQQQQQQRIATEEEETHQAQFSNANANLRSKLDQQEADYKKQLEEAERFRLQEREDKRKENQQKEKLERKKSKENKNTLDNTMEGNNSDNSPTTTATIAYAISLIKCGDKQSTSAGLVDAALVMRHSIHLQSSRNPSSGSNYDYHMYAIVHRDAVECSLPLQQAGFTIVVKDPPISAADITGSAHLKKFIHKEWCCGADEFVKLYAYELPGDEPIVVHVDIDFAFYQPMDLLYDAILFDASSPQGQAARAQIPLERPDDVLPTKIDAFITRDYPQLLPGRIPGYQAGFLVARKDPTMVPDILNVIKTHEYDGGYQRENGWGMKGYGGYVGAMAMQGLMAYYYDVIRPHTAVELNNCRFNHLGMDNLYRAHPNFKKNSEWVGKCRSQRPDCEDCTITNTTQIYNVHYTQCRKPWNCVANGVYGGQKGTAIDTSTGKLEHCLPLIEKWHAVRQDLQDQWVQATGDESIRTKSTTGEYRTDLFHGHCTEEGPKGYLQIQAKKETLVQLPKLYGDDDKHTTTQQQQGDRRLSSGEDDDSSETQQEAERTQ